MLPGRDLTIGAVLLPGDDVNGEEEPLPSVFLLQGSAQIK